MSDLPSRKKLQKQIMITSNSVTRDVFIAVIKEDLSLNTLDLSYHIP